MSWNRRDWLTAVTGAAFIRNAGAATASTVAVARCAAYGAGVLPAMRTMFEQLGGVGKLVAGKTVAVKISMSNPLRERTGFRPAWFTRWTHPDVIASVARLFGEAGARRIRILESSTEDAHPLEENFLIGGWDPNTLLKAAPGVEMENTSGLGSGTKYSRLSVPGGGLIYPAFDLNHSYADCDVMVSIANFKPSAMHVRFVVAGMVLMSCLTVSQTAVRSRTSVPLSLNVTSPRKSFEKLTSLPNRSAAALA